MTKKKLIIEIQFDEVTDEFDEEFTYLVPHTIKRHKGTTLTEGEMDSLGDSVAQTDRWQVDRWIDIQQVLSGVKKVRFNH